VKSSEVKKDLRKVAETKKVPDFQRFFKTKKGEYGEGDKFLGITVPNTRKIAKKYLQLSVLEVEKLLKSPWHEERLTALLILVAKFAELSKLPSKNAPKLSPLNQFTNQKAVFNFYLKNIKRVNNWDLVDLSAHKIVGAYLADKPRDLLFRLAKSKNLWERRISIIATFHFITNDDFSDSLKIGEILLDDKHDLIHKAVGWMLREIGKRNQKEEVIFLQKYYQKMPRTMLRYAIERFPEKLRQKYLLGLI